MDSKRQQQVARQIQKDLADIFLKELGHTLTQGAFITVTHVYISPDLSVAKIYLSIMLAKDKEEVLSLVKENTKLIRSKLSNKIGKNFRIVPEIIFYLDESADYAQKMDKVISQLDIPKAPTLDEE